LINCHKSTLSEWYLTLNKFKIGLFRSLIKYIKRNNLGTFSYKIKRTKSDYWLWQTIS